VGLLAVPAVGLESAFHDVGALSRTENARRNVDFNGGRELVSIGSAAVLKSQFPAQPVGSPPEVFHSCGKNCGKATVFGPSRREPSQPAFPAGRAGNRRYSLKFFTAGARVPRCGRP
jgi:hypothetical protein